MVKPVHNVSATQSGGADDALMRLFEMTVVLGEFMERGLAERGLTRARASLIWQLHRDGPMTQRALSQALRVTPRNVTGLVDALEKDGFVARSAHPSDRRATLVTLTDRGRDTAAALAADYRDGARYLFGGVAPADIATFVATMELVLARLHATR
jgi:DNA-binding MarR family transcriptional regulator